MATKSVDGVSATGAGSTVSPARSIKSDRETILVIVSSTGTHNASIAIEVSFDGTNWVVYQTVTAEAALAVPDFPFIRGNVTVWVEGVITVEIGASS